VKKSRKRRNASVNPVRGEPLIESHPHLAGEWRHTGPDNPSSVTGGSGKRVNWKHERCGRRLEKLAVSRRTRAFDEGCESEGCKYCSGSYLRKKTKPQRIPETLVRQCIKEKSLTLPRLLLTNSREIRLWQCPSGHQYRTRVSARLGRQKRPPQDCPCENCYKGSRINLKESHLDSLFKRTKRNSGYNPANLPVDHRAFWGCSKNNRHSSFMTYQEFLERGCRPCSREKTKLYLSDKRFEAIAREFVEAVRFPGWTPANIRAGSEMVCTWRCAKFPDHVWRKAVFRRTSDGEGCPFCAGKRLAVSNSLAAHPEIAIEWDYERNGTTPDTVRAGDRVNRYWFRCNNNHAFELTPWQRTSRQLGCKICRVVAGNLAETHPWAVEHWHPDPKKNPELTPYNLTAGSLKVIVWQCPVAEDHVYEKTVYDRCTRRLGCPFCPSRRGKRSSVPISG